MDSVLLTEDRPYGSYQDIEIKLVALVGVEPTITTEDLNPV